MNPIPVLATLCYNRGDLSIRMLQSIDYPIGKLVMVDNAVDESIVAANDYARKHFTNVVIFNPGYDQPKPVNLGFAGGFNWALRHHMAEWMLLVGNDVQFHPGQLQKIAEYWNRHKNDLPPMGVVNTNYGWHCTGITRAGLEVIGYLDENCTPLYAEDVDWNWRHTVARKQGLLSYPAEGECQIHVHHDGSATTKALSPEKAEKMAKAFERNVAYVTAKWGGAQTHEVFEHPFNDPSKSIRDWTMIPGRVQLNSLD